MRRLGYQIDHTVQRYLIPLSEISLDAHSFQNRSEAYSKESVTRIVLSLLEGNFDRQSLDPISLWLDKYSDKLYVISGHSRFHAFSLLSQLRQGKEEEELLSILRGLSSTTRALIAGMEKIETTYQISFDNIPAIVDQESTQEEAVTRAKLSNVLGTPEKLVDRVTYIRHMRSKYTGDIKTFVMIHKNFEGTQKWRHIRSLASLNPTGKAMTLLKPMKEEGPSYILLRKLSSWIGMARKRYPQLTDAHEDEIFLRLTTYDGYGKGKRQVSTKREFDSLLSRVFKNLGEDFDPEQPINIRNLQNLSYGLRCYYKLLEDAQAIINEKKKNLTRKFRLSIERALANNLSQHFHESGGVASAINVTKSGGVMEQVISQEIEVRAIADLTLKLQAITQLETAFGKGEQDLLLYNEAKRIWGLTIVDKAALKLRKDGIVQDNDRQTSLF